MSPHEHQLTRPSSVGGRQQSHICRYVRCSAGYLLQEWARKLAGELMRDGEPGGCVSGLLDPGEMHPAVLFGRQMGAAVGASSYLYGQVLSGSVPSLHSIDPTCPSCRNRRVKLVWATFTMCSFGKLPVLSEPNRDSIFCVWFMHAAKCQVGAGLHTRLGRLGWGPAKSTTPSYQATER